MPCSFDMINIAGTNVTRQATSESLMICHMHGCFHVEEFSYVGLQISCHGNGPDRTDVGVNMCDKCEYMWDLPVPMIVSYFSCRCADWRSAISTLRALNNTASNPCGASLEAGKAYPVPRIVVS